jgi:putative transposase
LGRPARCAGRSLIVLRFASMPRRARILSPGFPHHLTQRGNRRLDVFRDDQDRRCFLELLVRYFQRDRIEVWSYTLMTNHIHLIAVPETNSGLSAAMRDCLSDYALTFNKRYGYIGHLWQQRFYASTLGPDHLWNAVRYVERNPVRAGIVDRAENYPWSSAPFHCGLRSEDSVIAGTSPLIGAVPDWSAWLNIEEQADEFTFLRRNTNTNRPTASREFQEMLERVCGRRILPRKRGRKVASAKEGTGTIRDSDPSDCNQRKQNAAN